MNKYQVTITQTVPRKYYDEEKKVTVEYKDENNLVGEFVNFEDAMTFTENVLVCFKDVSVTIKVIKTEV